MPPDELCLTESNRDVDIVPPKCYFTLDPNDSQNGCEETKFL